VGAGPRPPELGRNWAQTEARGLRGGPRACCGGGRGGTPGLLFLHLNIKHPGWGLGFGVGARDTFALQDGLGTW
jgi:hypothetical protein